MAVSVQMPALGESVTEGTVTRWLKQEGDTVEQDEPLLEVSTDKVDTEIPAPTSGVLEKIVAQEDDTVEVGGDEHHRDVGDGGLRFDVRLDAAVVGHPLPQIPQVGRGVAAVRTRGTATAPLVEQSHRLPLLSSNPLR